MILTKLQKTKIICQLNKATVGKWIQNVFLLMIGSIFHFLEFRKSSLGFLFFFFLFFFFFFFFFFYFLGLQLWHMEIPRLGDESVLQLSAYATATAMPDLSHVWDLRHSSRQSQILTHWVRPGIEPATSWFLIRFISTAPWGNSQLRFSISNTECFPLNDRGALTYC